MNDAVQIVIGVLQGILSSTAFILVLFIGFCILVGFTKTRKSAGGGSVVKSLDETISRQTDEVPRPDRPPGAGRPAASSGAANCIGELRRCLTADRPGPCRLTRLLGSVRRELAVLLAAV